MLARCFRSDTRPWLGRVGLIALALVLVPALGSPEPQPVRKVNECNSDVTIDLPPGVLLVDQTITFTLTVENTDARDGMDAGIAQVFDDVVFTGHCQTPVGIPCDTEMMDNAFMYQGNVGGTCPNVMDSAMNGVVTFDFDPDLSLMSVTPPVPPDPVTCTITFEGSYARVGSFPVQATTMGVCQGGAFDSDTTVTSAVVVEGVPTMGEVALAILALLLVGASWLTLRRRNAPSAV